jgi:uncharacterized protein
MGTHSVACLLALVLVLPPARAGGEEPFTERGVAVPMRDGVVLRADVLRPAQAGRFPVLVYRTPYGKSDALHAYETFTKAVARGYAVVVQDVRGRYASAGTFEPYRGEGRDGYDTIEWAAAQPWSNGRVGLFGLSYPAAVQWLAALESPPHLVAMVPAMVFSTGRNFFYSGGAFDLSWIPWIWNNIAPDVRVRGGLAGPRTEEDAKKAWAGMENEVLPILPLSKMDALRPVAPYYYEWLAHPPGDPYWDFAEVRGRYDRVTAAVLNLSGWHDETYGPEGAIANFGGLVAARPGDPRTRLLIGPWTHGVEETGMARSGDRTFGPAAVIDYDETVLGFLDRHLRGVGGPAEPRVRVFVMGANRWREGETWPLPGVVPTVLHLAPPVQGRRGRLLPASASTGPASSAFVSDPARPVVDPFGNAAGAHDYRSLPDRNDVVAFDSDPLLADLEVVGSIGAEIVLSTDARDADLWLKLYDVAPDGTAWNLMSPGPDVLRASLREGPDHPRLLEPGQPVTLRFPNLVTGNLFRKGHRVRVLLCGSFMPHFSRNLQTGEWEATASQGRAATLTIHHGGGYDSRIVLPVLPPP